MPVSHEKHYQLNKQQQQNSDSCRNAGQWPQVPVVHASARLVLAQRIPSARESLNKVSQFIWWSFTTQLNRFKPAEKLIRFKNNTELPVPTQKNTTIGSCAG